MRPGRFAARLGASAERRTERARANILARSTEPSSAEPVDLPFTGLEMKEKAMLNVTAAARVYLNDLLEQADAPPECAVRILVESGKLSAAIDRERDGDSTFAHEGNTVLVLDQEAADVLLDRTLDVNPDSSKLVVA
jgi:Fe-S cluster assembly iron-binding protein IscA